MQKRTRKDSNHGANTKTKLVKKVSCGIPSSQRRCAHARLSGRPGGESFADSKNCQLVGTSGIHRKGVDREGHGSNHRRKDLGYSNKYCSRRKGSAIHGRLTRMGTALYAVGDILAARFIVSPPFLDQVDNLDQPTKIQQAGIQYEHKLVKTLKKLYGDDAVIAWGWIEYETDKKGLRYCQPDAIIIFDKYILIVEIKLSHTRAGKAKLKLLYKKVAEKIWPNIPIKLVQIFKNYRKAASKNCVSIYELDKLSTGEYYECQYTC